MDWTAGAVELLTEARAVAGRAGSRAGPAVSSFGLSGTNAHVILEQAAGRRGRRGRQPSRRPRCVVPAVAVAAAARPGRSSPGSWPTARTSTASPDVGRGPPLATARTALAHARSLSAATARAAGRALAALAAGEPAVVTLRRPVGAATTAFLFTGQGSQRSAWAASCTPRSRCSPRRSTRCATQLRTGCATPLLGRRRRRELLDQTGVTQPALFAFEVALFRLLESWGVRPDFVAGHSVGEIAAAHVAGVLSLADAARWCRRAAG